MVMHVAVMVVMHVVVGMDDGMVGACDLTVLILSFLFFLYILVLETK